MRKHKHKFRGHNVYDYCEKCGITWGLYAQTALWVRDMLRVLPKEGWDKKTITLQRDLYEGKLRILGRAKIEK